MWNFLKEKFFDIFTKIDISFSYGIGIEKLLAGWKYCNEEYVVKGSIVYFYFSIVSWSCDIRKCMVHSSGFLLWWHMSSWIEFIFDLSMWDSILVYIFEFIMEDMMMILHKFLLWYDTLYDDTACDNVDALLYNIMYMHTIVWWCSHMHYDVYLMLMMHKWCRLRWWWGCITYDEDTYPMTMMHTYDDDAWWCMPYV